MNQLQIKENKRPSSSDHPLVSIGMPIFNAENYLRNALDGILSQTSDGVTTPSGAIPDGDWDDFGEKRSLSYSQQA